jgi:hypothetical protein
MTVIFRHPCNCDQARRHRALGTAALPVKKLSSRLPVTWGHFLRPGDRTQGLAPPRQRPLAGKGLDGGGEDPLIGGREGGEGAGQGKSPRASPAI